MNNFIEILRARASYLLAEICELNQILDSYLDSSIADMKRAFQAELKQILVDLESLGCVGRG